jgi:hypothetical protein
MVSDDLYDALAAITDPATAPVYDTKLPDSFVLDATSIPTVLVFSSITDTPDTAIDGDLVHREARWQVSVRCVSLALARAWKAAVITALHGLSGTSVVRCDFDSSAGEFPDAETQPFSYHIPIDFIVQF